MKKVKQGKIKFVLIVAGFVAVFSYIFFHPAATSFTVTSPIAFAATFSDVGNIELYKSAIEFLTSEGIINGYPDGTYKPEQTVNRAEMMKIIAEGQTVYLENNANSNEDSGANSAANSAANSSEEPSDIFASYRNQKCFNDVPARQWYTKYICYGKDKGWIVGYSDGTFRPSQAVNFVEALKIAFKGFGFEYSENSDPWYKDVVESASYENLIPHSITGFAENLKRNQMADLVARIIKADKGLLNEYLGDRKNIVVTYESIEEGENLLELEIEVVRP